MAVSTITNTITGLDGTTGLPDIPVIVRLMPSGGWVTATGAEMVREYRTVTNSSGIWSLSLTETASITPGNTWYEVQELIPRAYGGPRKCNIQVGAANQTLYAALISTPATVPTTQYLTQAAGDARYVLAPGSFGGAASMVDSRPADTATAGVLAEYARIDHRHDREILSGTTATRTALTGNDLYAGLRFWDTTLGYLLMYNGTAWVCLTPQYANVATQQTTTSTSYTDLATAGPAVTVVTGTKALVTFGCTAFQTTAGTGNIAPAVSGATTRAAVDAEAISQTSTATGLVCARTVLITGLTAGSNTFTLKYKTTSNTLNVLNRDIIVVGIP